MVRDFRQNRSAGYQYVLLEIACPNDSLTEYSDSQGLTGKIEAENHKEDLMDLKEQLKRAQWRIINTELTPRQREVLRLSADGYTQTEIAKKLSVNQSSITKAINGNTDYRNAQRRTYGGAKKKIQRIAETDPEIIEILQKIAELEGD